MKKERENTSKIKLGTNNGMPMVSFAATGDAGVRLSPESFDISGNEFDAYYDGAHKLVFVLDKTITSDKPNVLLIINPIGDRKWDDILANDYHVDLETIRPKVDNKYQKLDIEYSGLSVYNQLINDFNSGNDTDAALAELSNFRVSSVRRAASDRLAAAEESIEKTRETIAKTNGTIREEQAHVKKLREKLSRQKKEIGREPTKQSAAKILKTEAQIDAANEKLKRSKKRLANAQRRLTAADEDAKIARRILGQPERLVKVPVTEITAEPLGGNMADEVKPLFDKDPEILDEKIAFKPIDFNVPNVEPAPVPVVPVYEQPTPVADVPAAAPLSFTPPTAPAPIKEEYVIREEPVMPTHVEPEPVSQQPVPVLDAITTVSEPQPAPQPLPVARPISPISGTATPIESGERKRPTFLYYLMLAILIILSIFTLWLYQRNTPRDNVPDLATTPKPEVVTPAPTPEVVESPFIQAEPTPVAPVVIAEPEPAPVVLEFAPEPEPIVEPEPAPELIMQPVAPVVAEPAPVPERVVNKPAYDVGSDKMFVADDYYDDGSAPVVAPAPTPAPVAVAPVITESAPGEYYTDDYYEDEQYYDDAGLEHETETYESYETYSDEY